MGITCEEVWRAFSDYLDGELDINRRSALEEHFAECRHCAAVLEGTCNIIRLYRDERVLAPPKGFHDRLHKRLNQRLNGEPEEKIHASRRVVLVWALRAAAAASLGFAVFSAKRIILPRLEHQRLSGSPDSHQVPEMVAISQDQDDKLYHAAGSSHLHGKPKLLPVDDAIREGYSPCPICFGKHKPAKKG